MVAQVLVSLNAFKDMHEGLEELFVLARIERLRELLKVGNFTYDREDVW